MKKLVRGLCAILLVTGCDELPTDYRPTRSLEVTPSGVSVKAGESARFRADADVSWRTLNPEVAAIDDDGVLTGLRNGQVIVEARGEDGVGYAVATVAQQLSGTSFHTNVLFEPRYHAVYRHADLFVLGVDHSIVTIQNGAASLVSPFPGFRLRRLDGVPGALFGIGGNQLVLWDGQEWNVVCRTEQYDEIFALSSHTPGVAWGVAGRRPWGGRQLFRYANGACAPIDPDGLLDRSDEIRDVAGVGDYVVATVSRFDGTSALLARRDGTWSLHPFPDDVLTQEFSQVEVLADSTVVAMPVYAGGRVVVGSPGSWSTETLPEAGGQVRDVWTNGTDYLVAAVASPGVGGTAAYVLREGVWSVRPKSWLVMSGLVSVWGTGPGEFIGVGGDEAVVRFREDWADPVDVPSFNAVTVWGASSEWVMGVGPDGAILFDGHRWVPMAGSPSGLRGLWGLGRENVVAFGTQTVHRFVDGSWTELPIDLWIHEHITKVWGVAPDEFYVITDAGRALLYDGVEFHQVLRVDYYLGDIWGTASDEITIAAGRTLGDPDDGSEANLYSEGRVYRFDGRSWKGSPGPEGTSVRLIWALGPDDLYVYATTPYYEHGAASWLARGAWYSLGEDGGYALVGEGPVPEVGGWVVDRPACGLTIPANLCPAWDWGDASAGEFWGGGPLQRWIAY